MAGRMAAWLRGGRSVEGHPHAHGAPHRPAAWGGSPSAHPSLAWAVEAIAPPRLLCHVQVTSSPGHWLVADVEVAAAQEDGAALLEFVVTNKQDGWDKPLLGVCMGGDRGERELITSMQAST